MDESKQGGTMTSFKKLTNGYRAEEMAELQSAFNFHKSVGGGDQAVWFNSYASHIMP